MNEQSLNFNENAEGVTVLDPGVSLVKKSNNDDGALSIIFKILLAFAFMAAGLLAILYSINNTDSQTDENVSNETVGAFKAIYNNQFCLNGVRTIERIVHNKKKVSKQKLRWMQDHDNHRILFNITDEETNTYTSYLVYSDKVLIISKDDCNLHNDITGYFDFLISMGLQGLKKTRVETVDIEGKKREVQVSQGRPSLNRFFDGSGQIPIYTLGYEGLESGILYGWQLYYEPDFSRENSTEWAEYWFPEMKKEKPDPNIFVNMPHHCYKMVNK